MTLCCQDIVNIVIRKSEFVTKTQFLSITIKYLLNLYIWKRLSKPSHYFFQLSVSNLLPLCLLPVFLFSKCLLPVFLLPYINLVFLLPVFLLPFILLPVFLLPVFLLPVFLLPAFLLSVFLLNVCLLLVFLLFVFLLPVFILTESLLPVFYSLYLSHRISTPCNSTPCVCQDDLYSES